MKSFTDNKSRVWSIDMTIGSVKRVKSALGVDLLELEAGDPPLLTRLGTDTILVCDIVRSLLEPQLKTANITADEFDSALGGAVIASLFDAFYEALSDFFQSRSQPLRSKMILAQRQLILLAAKRGEAMVDAMDMEAIIDGAFGKASTRSPEPSA
jgi:hypothetical protein